MGFGRLSPFPLRLGETKSAAQKWLDEIKASLGDSFTQENQSIVGSENIALARLFTMQQWQAEKLQNNSLPGTSYDLVLDWAQKLGVPFRSTDSIASIRSACAAQYKASGGSTETNIEDSLSLLLQNSLIDVTYFYGDLDHIPEGTYWPPNPAPDDSGDLGLGNGTWTSPRAHILISVQQSSGQSLNDLLYLVNVQMFHLLDRMLPAWATFDFNLGEYADGFIIAGSDTDPQGSLLNFTAL